jgi:hypothetical protein
MARKWTALEDEALIKAIKKRLDLNEIASIHHRSINALNIRMTKLFTSQVIDNKLDPEFSTAMSFYTKKKERVKKEKMEEKKEETIEKPEGEKPNTEGSKTPELVTDTALVNPVNSVNTVKPVKKRTAATEIEELKKRIKKLELITNQILDSMLKSEENVTMPPELINPV